MLSNVVSVETMRDIALHDKYQCPKGEITYILTRKRKMKERMKKTWKYFLCVAESFGRARAASSLARQGQYKLAQQIMTEKCECC